MRNPGRCDGDDARSDSTDPMQAQTGPGDVPADDVTAALRVPDAPRLPFAAGDDGLSDLDDDLPDDAADFDDDLLFDPLLSDEPIDLAAVRADDALIDALGGLGGLDSANDVVDPDDPLIAMLAAWAASARPESARPDTAAEKTATGDAGPVLRAVPEIPAEEPVGASTTAIEPAARMDQPTVRLSAPAGPADDSPADDSPTEERDDSSAAPAVAASGPTAPVIGLVSRARALRRRSRPGGRPLPSDHPLRRAAVAVVVAALGISGAAASGGTAVPGDPAWAITKVFFPERAQSIEAAAVVIEGLERARLAIKLGQPDVAKTGARQRSPPCYGAWVRKRATSSSSISSRCSRPSWR